jgi:hypothetical protein
MCGIFHSACASGLATVSWLLQKELSCSAAPVTQPTMFARRTATPSVQRVLTGSSPLLDCCAASGPCHCCTVPVAQVLANTPQPTLTEYSMGSTPALLMVTVVRPDAPSMTPPARPSTDTTGLGSMLGSACLTRALKGRPRGPLSASKGRDADSGSSAYKGQRGMQSSLCDQPSTGCVGYPQVAPKVPARVWMMTAGCYICKIGHYSE